MYYVLVTELNMLHLLITEIEKKVFAVMDKRDGTRDVETLNTAIDQKMSLSWVTEIKQEML